MDSSDEEDVASVAAAPVESIDTNLHEHMGGCCQPEPVAPKVHHHESHAHPAGCCQPKQKGGDGEEFDSDEDDDIPQLEETNGPILAGGPPLSAEAKAKQ